MSRTVISKKDIDISDIGIQGRFSIARDEYIGVEEEDIASVSTLSSIPDLETKLEPSFLSPMEADKYTSRLLKYIPAEVIALYLTLDALIRSSEKLPLWVHWSIFVFGIFATYLYLWRIEKVNKLLQLAISVVAYCIWVFALGGPFVHTGWYEPIYAGILLPIYTFLVAVIEA